MNYGMLPTGDTYAILNAKLHALELELARFREELADLRERLAERESRG